MLVIEIDAANIETLQTSLASGSHIGRVSTDLPLTIGETNSKFSGKFDLVSVAVLESLTDEDFVGEWAVDVGGVEKSDAAVDGVVDQSDHVGVGLGRAVEGGHAHAAKTLCGHFETLRTELDSRNLRSHYEVAGEKKNGRIGRRRWGMGQFIYGFSGGW